MCHRNVALPVRLLIGAGVLGLVALLMGFVWSSARLKNKVDRILASRQEVLTATQQLVAESPALQNPISFSALDQTAIEHWDNRRWRVSGYVDTRGGPGVKVRTLYFAVVQQVGSGWNLEDLQLQSMEFSRR
jgi:hypothetical protein